MVKKVASIAGAGALLLSMAMPVMGNFIPYFPMQDSGDVEIFNYAKVDTDVYTKAYTGDNEIGGMCVNGGEIDTGAATAITVADIIANYTEVGCFDCDGDVTVKNMAKVYTDLYTKADTGDNEIGGKFVWGGEIDTDEAMARTDVGMMVNFSLVGVDGYED